MRHIILVCLLCFSATGCAPTAANRGNLLEADQMKQVVAGVDGKQEVAQKLGSPTTIAPFDDNTWYYMGQKTEKRGIFDPQIKQERIVEVKFGSDGLVDSLQERRDGREAVDIVSRRTPTSGNDYTFIQQMLGNLGKFNTPEGNAATTATGGSVPTGRN